MFVRINSLINILWNKNKVHKDFSIPNSLPFNTISFGSVICPMDDPDIERAEKQKY